ncbi:uncharacterized protein N7503_007083 [Penicillium pulvis]|uniref:uncharacterized protein n=1 Tax=Penicillium pulvis TaxID=1562058 RepID=UPI0025479527|nr:uncharacterized protein N7503_007083 [Penicillium pulvis]KAJ5797787.1 hypothetical protein N7503_007083 [Penicillium pulvis]
MNENARELSHSDYTVGWICALPGTELVAAGAMLDEEHTVLQAADPNDINSYLFGRIGDHNVVIACLPVEQTGKVSAATVAKDMVRSFPAIRFGLMVGIGGGAPFYGAPNEGTTDVDESDESEDEGMDKIQDIRLGDVVISQHSKSSEAVLQYDFGKSVQGQEFIRAGGQLNKPPGIVLNAISMLKGQHARKGHKICDLLSEMLANNPRMRKNFKHPGSAKDHLFKSEICHVPGKKCESCQGPDGANLVKRKQRLSEEPQIHYGTIGSADQVMKDALLRDKWSQTEKIKCFEMEAAGLMDTLPCLVIRGICDYADSHKNKVWQPYAAAVAAAYAKELLHKIAGQGVLHLPPVDKAMFKVLRKLEQLELRQVSDRETACLQAFRTTDYEYQKDFNPDKEDGTCSWCHQSPIFQNWQENHLSCLLWITADPGCGKSVLCKDLVDKRLFGLESSDTTICYFFFKDTSAETRSPANAVAAFLHQVLKSKNGWKAMRHALPAYLENAEKVCQSLDVMWTILKDISQDPECGRIILVLDALDECEAKDQKSFIRRLKGLECDVKSQAPTHHLKVVVTSRPYFNLENEFSELTKSNLRVRLPGEKLSTQLQSEMNYVVHARMSRLGSRIVKDTTREELLRGILATENRTYLWLDLVFKIIEQMPRIDRQTVKALLGNLPQTVDDVYNSILLKAPNQVQAKRLLQIIVAATRPLRLREVGVALAITEETECYEDLELQSGEQLATSVRNICGLFVHIVDETVFLIHQSAKEFLISLSEEVTTIWPSWKYSISVSDSALLLTSICIRFIYLKELGKKKAPPIREAEELASSYDFLDYSANSWAVHFGHMTIQDRHHFSPQAMDLCSVETDRYMDWEIAVRRVGRSVHPFPLHIASYLGLDMVVRTLLASPGVDVNSKTDDNRTPIFCAVDNGHEGIVKILLAIPGIDINMPSSNGNTPLSMAIILAHKGIVKLLLAAPSIEINSLDENGYPPLHLAIYQGDESIVKLLLNTPGIDINMTNRGGFHPLFLASFQGNEGIVKLLLTAPGFEINSLNEKGHSLLCLAIYQGHEGILKLLLDNPGIDINIADGDGKTPLYYAINQGYEDTVKLLLNNPGIDINMTSRGGFSPLSLASSQGHEGIVKLLLTTPGIDINMANGGGKTPLSYAIYQGHEDIVKLLLTAPGIDINMADGGGNPPLSYAILQGHEGIVKLLLATPGIDVNIANRDGFQPLSLASLKGHEGILKKLLTAPGIDINMAGRDGFQPLSLASSRGHEGIVKLLLTAPGIDINIADGDGNTPLTYAIHQGHEGIVKLLLTAPGIDINIAGRHSAPPLSLASFKGHEGIVKLLLAAPGVDINMVGREGFQPLFLASFQGHEGTVKLLSDALRIDINSDEVQDCYTP